jgi:hypothetical protein
MKVGDYVAKITNEWMKHNRWLDFEEELQPLGLLIGRSSRDGSTWFWDVLMSCGGVESFSEKYLKVIHES